LNNPGDEKVIALLHPGAMGAGMGAVLVKRGVRVVSPLDGRSAATRRRAAEAGIEDAGSLAQALRIAGTVVSVCPPHGAAELAREVARAAHALGWRGCYLDANAVSPETAREIEAVLAPEGVACIDGGIVGLPPGKASSSRLFLSAAPSGQESARRIAALFEGSDMQGIVIAGPVGAASALKMCYAAWTKGVTALLADIRALARHEGVDEPLMEEWARSQTGTGKRSEYVAATSGKAWRWVGEMQEIAQTFEAAGLPGGFHLAAAEVYSRLEAFKDQEPATLDAVVAALRRAPPGGDS
jgi:3-hydroxyisobutyrate dehydrogenase-like beta-hydroxyacid dehydrogenase